MIQLPRTAEKFLERNGILILRKETQEDEISPEMWLNRQEPLLEPALETGYRPEMPRNEGHPWGRILPLPESLLRHGSLFIRTILVPERPVQGSPLMSIGDHVDNYKVYI